MTKQISQQQKASFLGWPTLFLPAFHTTAKLFGMGYVVAEFDRKNAETRR